jgi:hypothetical protein
LPLDIFAAAEWETLPGFAFAGFGYFSRPLFCSF